MVLSVIKNANLALTFLLELGVLAALGYWGFQTGQGTIASIGRGIGAPVLAVVVWWLFGAPQAKWHLNGVFRLLLEVIFFGSAAVSLYATGQHVLGVAFALVFILNTVMTSLLGQYIVVFIFTPTHLLPPPQNATIEPFHSMEKFNW